MVLTLTSLGKPAFMLNSISSDTGSRQELATRSSMVQLTWPQACNCLCEILLLFSNAACVTGLITGLSSEATPWQSCIPHVLHLCNIEDHVKLHHCQAGIEAHTIPRNLHTCPVQQSCRPKRCPYVPVLPSFEVNFYTLLCTSSPPRKRKRDAAVVRYRSIVQRLDSKIRLKARVQFGRPVR